MCLISSLNHCLILRSLFLVLGGESDNGSRGRNRSIKHTSATANSGPLGSGTSNTESFTLRKKYHYRKVLVPNQEQLECLNLRDGENEISFQLDGCVPLKAQLFVWPENSKIIVTDIEGESDCGW